MKKILFISHMYPTSHDKSYGKVIHEQAISLMEKGHQIKVISPIPYTPFVLSKISNRFYNYYNTPRFEVHDDIEVYYPKYLSLRRSPLIYNFSSNMMYSSIFRQAKEIKKNFDFELIHAHFAFPDAYVAMKISEYFNVKLITTLQATDLDKTFNISVKFKNKLKDAFNYSDIVISPTPRLKQQLYNYFEIPSEVIGYGINLNKNIETENNMSTRTNIVSVSRLLKTKGIDDNLLAIKLLREKNIDVRYTIIGDGSEKNNILKRISDLGLRSHVDYKGALPHDEVLDWISKADIFSLPSWQETFGLVYLEAMQFRKPVIGCKGQGFDGIIKNYYNGFLAEPKNPKSIADIIEYIIAHPFEVEQIGVNARRTVKKDFTFDIIANRIDELYENSLIEKGGK